MVEEVLMNTPQAMSGIEAKSTPEHVLRRALDDCRAVLAGARARRDEANVIIKAHVAEERTLARAVAVFDRQAAKDGQLRLEDD